MLQLLLVADAAFTRRYRKKAYERIVAITSAQRQT